MSLFERMGQRRNVVIGAAVIGVSLVWAIAPAAAAAPSRTTLTTSTPTVGVGSLAKLKAVVKPTTGTLLPTGTVTFREGTLATSPPVSGAVNLTTINGVQTAKFETSTLTVGTHTFIATYSGSGTFNASTSLTTKIVVTEVTKVNSETTGSTSTPTVVPGGDVKLKAVVKADPPGPTKPTGTVTFSDGATTLGTGPVPLLLVGTVMTAKLTVTTLSAGSHSITATYSGSASFNPSSFTPILVTIGKQNVTCSVKATPSATDATKTVMIVTVKPPAGLATATGGGNFIIDNLTTAPQAYTLEVGATTARITNFFPAPTATHTVRATYDGDAAYNACNTTTFTFTAP